MKDLKIYRKDLINKIKSTKLSEDWKKMVSALGIAGIVTTSGFLIGCEQDTVKEEPLDEGTNVEEELEEEQEEHTKEEEQEEDKEEELSEEELEAIKVGEMFDALLDRNAPFDERGLSLVLDIKEILATEDIVSRKTGELVKVDELREKYGDFWGVFYASHLSDIELKKVITYRDYLFKAIPNDVIFREEIVILKHFLIRDAFHHEKDEFYYGDVLYEITGKYERALQAESLRDQHGDAMRYRTAFTNDDSAFFIRSTLIPEHDINSVSREALEIVAGRSIAIGHDLEKALIEEGYDLTHVWDEEEYEIPGVTDKLSEKGKNK